MKLAFLTVVLIAGCSSLKKTTTMEKSQSYTFPQKEGTFNGGHSGLFYEGENIFWTHTDRGPNAEPVMEGDKQLRPFIEPTYQPRLIQFKLDPVSKAISILKEVLLTLPDGSRFTGLPNFFPTKDRTGDETPVDTKLKPLPLDNMGIDPEGICFNQQNIWLSEEYGPSLLKFDLNGKLQTRFVPKGYYSSKEIKALRAKYGKRSIQDILPERFMNRKLNRGLEGLTCGADKLYSALQSPLPGDNNDVAIIEFDLKREKVTKEIKYTLASKEADKIGDMVLSGEKLYVIEQNSKTGSEGIHHVYESHLIGGKILNTKFLLDLATHGFDYEKIEGITLIDKKTLAIVNDNDFALEDKSKVSILGIINLK